MQALLGERRQLDQPCQQGPERGGAGQDDPAEQRPWRQADAAPFATRAGGSAIIGPGWETSG